MERDHEPVSLVGERLQQVIVPAGAAPGAPWVRAIAELDGGPGPEQAVLLGITAERLGLATIPPPSASPREALADLARRMRGERAAADRQALVEAALVMALARGAATPAAAALLEALAGALEVHDSTLTVFRRIAGGHLRLARATLLRRLAAPIVREAWESRGLSGVVQFTRVAFGKSPVAPERARRFAALGALPEGTLGRGFVDHCRSRGLGLPGEPKGLSEVTVSHDFLHVLSGYDTDPRGELLIGGLTAGMQRADPFAILVFVLCQFHLGVPISFVASVDRGMLDASALLHAWERGRAMSADLSRGWDLWDDVARPLDEVRARYGLARE